ncbi:hypothetical protein ACXGQW_04585 [Wenyingzhuangia sp. IMCC45533]
MVKTIKTIITVCCFLTVLFSGKIHAQLGNSVYNDDTKWQISGVFASAKNVWDQKAFDKEVELTSVDLSFYKSNFSKGARQYSYRIKYISDFIPQLASPLFEESRDQLFAKSGLPVLTSLLGWYNTAWSLTNSNKFQVAVGVHLGGYTYGIEVEREDEDNGIGDTFPFVAGGPALIVDVALPFNLELHYEGSYAYAYQIDPDKEIPDDETLYFLNQNLQLRRKRWFASYELVSGTNDTGNKIVRSQFGLGYAFF